MTDESLNPSHLTVGLRVSQASIVWTLITASITISLGIASSSLVLTAFGFTGLFDAAGSAAIVIQMRHGLKHEYMHDSHERIAFRIVVTGLTVVAVATVGASIYRLLSDGAAEASALGIVVSALSCLVLANLARIKRRVGKAIPSGALQADGVLSFVGSGLALVTVVGSFFTHAGVEWVDPVAAIIVALIAFVSAIALHLGSDH